jgi:hypothetical protein
MSKPTVATLSFDALASDALVQEPAPRPGSHSSDRAYLVSIGLLAALIIGVFFGIGFSLITAPAEKHTTSVSLARDRGSEVYPLSASAFEDPHGDLPSVPIEAELSRSAARLSSPITPRSQGPMPGSAPPGNKASVTAATDASPNSEAPAPQSATREATPAPSASPPSVSELLARGDSFVRSGDIASARAFYQRAADAGDARGALRMGATFDPAFLSRTGMDGTAGNPAEARSWYQRAYDLGLAEADRRHKRIATK